MGKKKVVDGGHAVDVRGERINAVLRHAELSFRERLVLTAFMHFEPQQGRLCGMPGVCWPTDQEVADYLGTSLVTVRRGRRSLATARPNGGPALIGVRYVGPFGRLPNGETSLHGTNVLTLKDIAGDVATTPVVAELAEARASAARLERELASVQRRIASLAGTIEAERSAAAVGNDVAKKRRGGNAEGGRALAKTRGPLGNKRPGPSTHNAPSVTIPGWSVLRLVSKGRIARRAGELAAGRRAA